jgi:hypothetical protein
MNLNRHGKVSTPRQLNLECLKVYQPITQEGPNCKLHLYILVRHSMQSQTISKATALSSKPESVGKNSIRYVCPNNSNISLCPEVLYM